MASHSQPILYMSESLLLYATRAFSVARALLNAAWIVLFCRPAGWSIKRTVAVSIVRAKLSDLSLQQSRAVNSPTGETISNFCRSIGLTHKTFTIQCKEIPDATLHFINCQPRDSGATLLYFHGGGYRDSLDGSAHLSFVRECAHAMHATNLIFLEYTLAPQLKYPGQLKQAVAALTLLLQSRPASHIVIAGDSAGANLVLAVLAHIKHPKTGVNQLEMKSNSESRFRGAMLISPWVNCRYDATSFSTNTSMDILDRSKMEYCNVLWQPMVNEVWASPVECDDQFWKQVPAAKTLILVGSDEVFRDDILLFAQKMHANPFGSGSDVELGVAEGEIHVQCIIDAAVKDGTGVMTKQALEWIKALPQ